MDPDKVPPEGVHAICSGCLRVFPVEPPADPEDQQVEVGEPRAVQDSATTVVDVAEQDDASPVKAVAESDVEVDSGVEAAVEQVVVEPEPATEEGEAGEASPEVAAPDQSEAAEQERETAVAEETEGEPAAEERPAFEDLTTLAPEALAERGSDSGEAVAGSLSLGASRFGSRDPHERAKRLARVLVSDIIAYYPARYRESLSNGTLKEDFTDEVAKSWREFVDQVGEDLAQSTTYFNEALNEILAKGDQVF